MAALKRLPPSNFVTRVVNGQPVYLYADPLVCRCVYFGTEQNWAAYRQAVFARQLAGEAQMTAIMNQEAWDWGPWGWPWVAFQASATSVSPPRIGFTIA